MRQTLFLALVCLLHLVAVAQDNHPWTEAKGNGTLVSPWLIENAGHLTALAGNVNSGNEYAGQYFALAGDITATGSTAIGNSIEYPFRGCLDGRGFTVTCLSETASDEAATYQLSGLFGYLGEDATVTNLHVDGSVEVSGADNSHLFAGAIAAVVGQGATVRNCTAAATVTATGKSSGTLNLSAYVGNLAGYNFGTIVNCAATGDKIPETTHVANPYIGTVIGKNGFPGELFIPHYAINGTATLPEGAIGDITVELKDDAGNTLSTRTGASPFKYTLDRISPKRGKSYSLSISANRYDQATCTPSFMEKTPEVKLSLNQGLSNYEWYMYPADGGTFDGTTYKISSYSELEALAHIVNGTVLKSFDLGQALAKSDFTGKTIQMTNDIYLYWDWTPIGITWEKNTPFKGTFDGNGKNISGLEITGKYPASGLFGYINNATIKNLTISDVTINNEYEDGDIYAGAFVGSAESSQLSDLIVNNVSIKANATKGIASAGGIAGGCSNSSLIANCAVLTNSSGNHITATCIGSQSQISAAGGIIGNINGTEAIITNCYSTANISLTCSDSAPYICIGGIVGYGYTSLSNCYASGTITVKADNKTIYYWAGGIAGYGHKLSDCYALATTITGIGSNERNKVGRITGERDYYSSSERTYANNAMTFNDETSFDNEDNENGTSMEALTSSPWWQPDGTRSITDMLNAFVESNKNATLDSYSVPLRLWKVGKSVKEPAGFDIQVAP